MITEQEWDKFVYDLNKIYNMFSGVLFNGFVVDAVYPKWLSGDNSPSVIITQNLENYPYQRYIYDEIKHDEKFQAIDDVLELERRVIVPNASMVQMKVICMNIRGIKI